MTTTQIEQLRAALAAIRQQRKAARKKRSYASKLDPYRYPLIGLANEGASLADMKAWLKTKGLTAARSTIFMALRRWTSSDHRPHFLDPAWTMKDGEAQSDGPPVLSEETVLAADTVNSVAAAVSVASPEQQR